MKAELTALKANDTVQKHRIEELMAEIEELRSGGGSLLSNKRVKTNELGGSL